MQKGNGESAAIVRAKAREKRDFQFLTCIRDSLHCTLYLLYQREKVKDKIVEREKKYEFTLVLSGPRVHSTKNYTILEWLDNVVSFFFSSFVSHISFQKVVSLYRIPFYQNIEQQRISSNRKRMQATNAA